MLGFKSKHLLVCWMCSPIKGFYLIWKFENLGEIEHFSWQGWHGSNHEKNGGRKSRYTLPLNLRFSFSVACSFLSNLFSLDFFFFYLFYFPPFINLCCFFFSFPPVFSPCSLFQLFPSCFSFCLICWGNSSNNRHGSSGMVWSQSADQTADQPCHKMGEPQ